MIGHGEPDVQSVVVLVDEDITRDKRVMASLADYPDALVIDCASEEPGAFLWVPYLKAVLALLWSVLHGSAVWGVLRREHGLDERNKFTGLRASLRSFIKAHHIALHLLPSVRGVRLIHAHDLFCGVIGAELSRLTGAELIYDAHEIEFHRNRKNSWLRTAFDVVVEKNIIERAREVRVVNAPIARLYELIHGIPSARMRVIPNNHFSVCAQTAIVSPSAPTTFVYVGGGVRGRRLECLAAGAASLGVQVHAFFIGEVPRLAIESGWILGDSDYIEELVFLVTSYKSVMWCCVDDTCLSYRLSLPNKFFQAVAVGIPVVVSAGTYLAQLVEKYNIGFIFDGSNLGHILEEMQGEGFAARAKEIHVFSKALADGSLNL